MVFGFSLFGGRARSQSGDSTGSAGAVGLVPPTPTSAADTSSLSALDTGIEAISLSTPLPDTSAPSLSALPSSSSAAAAPPRTSRARASAGAGAGAGALTSADSSPPDAAVCPPLTAVPRQVLAFHPELALSRYNLTKPDLCINVLAIVHNAARLEMADMCADILPVLRACSTSSSSKDIDAVAGSSHPTPNNNNNRPTPNISDDDIQDLRKWWAGFARFLCTSSLVEDMVVKKAFDDVYVGFRKETRAIEKLFQKIQEKNNVYLELAVKKMSNAIEDFASNPRDASVITLAKAWGVLYTLVTDIYTMSEDMVTQIDRFGTDPLEYKDLEKAAAKIYIQRKRWSDRDEEKRGEMIVILTRWMADEAFMRNWMSRYLPKSEAHRANKWLEDYRTNRLVIVDRFSQKRMMYATAADRDAEIGVGGSEFPTSQTAVVV